MQRRWLKFSILASFFSWKLFLLTSVLHFYATVSSMYSVYFYGKIHFSFNSHCVDILITILICYNHDTGYVVVKVFYILVLAGIFLNIEFADSKQTYTLFTFYFWVLILTNSILIKLLPLFYVTYCLTLSKIR